MAQTGLAGPCSSPNIVIPKIATTLLTEDGLQSLVLYNAIDTMVSARSLSDYYKILKNRIIKGETSNDIKLATIFNDLVDIEKTILSALASGDAWTMNLKLREISNKAAVLRSKYCYRSMGTSIASMYTFSDRAFSLGRRAAGMSSSAILLSKGFIGESMNTPATFWEMRKYVISHIQGLIGLFGDSSDIREKYLGEAGAEMLVNLLKGNVGTALSASAFCRLIDPLVGAAMAFQGVSGALVSHFTNMLKSASQILSLYGEAITALRNVFSTGLGSASFVTAIGGIGQVLPSIIKTNGVVVETMMKATDQKVLSRVGAAMDSLSMSRRRRVLDGDLSAAIGGSPDSVDVITKSYAMLKEIKSYLGYYGSISDSEKKSYEIKYKNSSNAYAMMVYLESVIAEHQSKIRSEVVSGQNSSTFDTVGHSAIDDCVRAAQENELAILKG